MNRDQALDMIGEVLKAVEDVGKGYWDGLDERAEREYPMYQYFQGTAAQISQVVGQLREGTSAPGWHVPPWKPGDLAAAVVFRLSTDGRAASVQLAVLLSVDTDEACWVCARFESPEGDWYRQGDGEDPSEGEHDYSHVQLSGEVRGGQLNVTAKAVDQGLMWSKLAPPLPARDVIDLLLCALLAIRHPEFIRRVAGVTRREVVRQRVERLLAEQPEAIGGQLT